MTGAELAVVRSPLTGPPDINHNGPTPRFVGDLWFCTAAGGAFTANTLYEHDGAAWRFVVVPGASPLTNALSGNVALNNTVGYFDGPSVAQGTTGVWLAMGSVVFIDPVSANANFLAKLWDGTTVVASGIQEAGPANTWITMSLSGLFTAPAGNIRISGRDGTSVNGLMASNQSGNGKDSTLTAWRVG